MSYQLGRLVSEILHRYFGEIVQKVGNDLFSCGSKPISLIVKYTGLPRSQVIESLRTLVKFDLVTFEPSYNEVVSDYKLVTENVLLLIRYPRYLLQIKSKFGSVAELLVEELLQQAQCTATVLIITLAMRHRDDTEKNVTIVNLKDTFISLATAGYIQQAPVAETTADIPTLVPVATIVPDLDARVLMQAMTSGNIAEVKDNIYWKVNYERFHQDFRDEVMIKAITRRIDDTAGELMRLLLEQMYLTSSPSAPESNPLSAVDLKEFTRRASDNALLQTHLDQYLKVLEENGADFVSRVGGAGGAGGGAVCVRAQAASGRLAQDLLEHLVCERLGGKAARIFRLIRSKKYIDEDEIQKHAMLPNKECKELTYKLMAEHFISVQPMRKAASSGGFTKAIYLYHVKFRETCLHAQQMCYRALHNLQCASRAEVAAHARLRDKQRRVRTVVHAMRARGEAQAHIDDVLETLTPPELAVLQGVEKRLKQLSVAELELDKSLFILNWYLSYPDTS